MRLPRLVTCSFVERVNRFRVTVSIKGEEVDAHLPNSGRLRELLTPGRSCWVAPAHSSHRKTAYDLKLVEYAGVLVSVDARLPNPLFAEALEEQRLSPFEACHHFDREVSLGESRVDFRLLMPDGPLWIETKSVTLVEDGVARFPDAPTNRGTRHVRELEDVTGRGDRAGIVFVVQRSDAVRFTPHDGADPSFGQALRTAAAAGVRVYAWTCQVSHRAIKIGERIPIDLS